MQSKKKVKYKKRKQKEVTIFMTNETNTVTAKIDLKDELMQWMIEKFKINYMGGKRISFNHYHDPVQFTIDTATFKTNPANVNQISFAPRWIQQYREQEDAPWFIRKDNQIKVKITKRYIYV